MAFVCTRSVSTLWTRYFVFGIFVHFDLMLTFGLNQFSLFVCIAGSQASVTFLIKAEIGDSVCLWTVSFFELVAVEKLQCRHVTNIYFYSWTMMHYGQYKQVALTTPSNACYARSPKPIWASKRNRGHTINIRGKQGRTP